MTQGCASYTVYFVNCKARRALGPSVWTPPKFPPLFLSPVRSAGQKLLFPVYKWGSQDRPTATHWPGVEPAPGLHLLSRPALHLAPVVASLFSQRLRKGALESDRLGLEFWSCTGCEIAGKPQPLWASLLNLYTWMMAPFRIVGGGVD